MTVVDLLNLLRTVNRQDLPEPFARFGSTYRKAILNTTLRQTICEIDNQSISQNHEIFDESRIPDSTIF